MQAHTHAPTHACTHSRFHTARTPPALTLEFTYTHTHGHQAGCPAPHGNSRLSFLPLAFCTKRDAFTLVIKADSPASACVCVSQPGQRRRRLGGHCGVAAHTRTHTSTHTDTHTHMHTHIHTHAYTCVRVHRHKCTHTCTHAHTCTYTCTHMRTHVCTHTHTHTHTHTYSEILVLEGKAVKSCLCFVGGLRASY